MVYTPSHFAVEDREVLFDHIERTGLALLIGVGGQCHQFDPIGPSGLFGTALCRRGESARRFGEHIPAQQRNLGHGWVLRRHGVLASAQCQQHQRGGEPPQPR